MGPYALIRRPQPVAESPAPAWFGGFPCQYLLEGFGKSDYVARRNRPIERGAKKLAGPETVETHDEITARHRFRGGKTKAFLVSEMQEDHALPEGIGRLPLRQARKLPEFPRPSSAPVLQPFGGQIGVGRVSPRHVGDDSLRRKGIGIEDAGIDAEADSADLDLWEEPRE